jgi:phosphoglycolate phosphatase
MSTRARAVLFDLDGTLIDSAPDLAGACNDMRVERGLEPLPYEALRCVVGSGARGMVDIGFGVLPDDARYRPLRDEFLARYEARMTQETRVFPEALPVLDRLRERDLAWGIVTNKAMRFAKPLVAWLDFGGAVPVLVCGDSTPHAKPHPAPLLEAARRLGVAAADCAYVGDDRRDVDAGRAAGMRTVAAAWGYLGRGEPATAWGADVVLSRPADLLAWIDSP